VVISGEPISSPVVDEIDILVAFNRPSLEKFSSSVRELILYDMLAGEFQGSVRSIPVAATEIATQKGAQQAANTAMLGALMATGRLGLPEDSYVGAIKDAFSKKPKLVPLNLEIFRAGADWVRKMDR